MIKNCKHCGKPFKASSPCSLYCPKPCRDIVRVIQQEKHRKIPKNRKKAAERARQNYSNRRKIRGKIVTPYMKSPHTKKELFNLTAHLSRGIYTRSDFQRLSPEHIIKAMSKPITISIPQGG